MMIPFSNYLSSMVQAFRLVLCLSCCVSFNLDVLSDEPSDHERFQGTWEGVLVGKESEGKIKLSISGDSFHFHRDKEFWFKTEFKLHEDVSPKQLHTKIKDCPTSDIIGKDVFAIYKIEQGHLILGSGGDSVEELPKNFEGEDMLLYKFKKVLSALE